MECPPKVSCRGSNSYMTSRGLVNLLPVNRVAQGCFCDTHVQVQAPRPCNSFSLIGSRALAAYGDVDGSSAANTRPWSRKGTPRLLRRSDASASARDCGGTRSVRRGGAGSVG